LFSDGRVGSAKRRSMRGARALEASPIAARAVAPTPAAATRDVTGPGITSSVAMEAADLGILRWDPDRNAIAAMFGDNYEFVGMHGEWLSPSIVMYDNNYHVLGVPDPGTGIAMRRRSQLWPYQHNNWEYSTILPCDFIKIGNWWHAAVMVTKGLGNELRTEFHRSRDLVDWEVQPELSLPHPSHPGNVILTFDQIGDYVYIFGTGGLARNKPIWMWRNPANQFPNGWWEPWGWDGSRWGWGIPNENTPILDGAYGELSFRYLQGNCVLSYFDAGEYKQQARTVQNPEGNWRDGANLVDYAFGSQIPQLYGGYISPLSRLNEGGGMHFWVSQWNTQTNDPYRVMVVQGALKATGPLDAEPREAVAPDLDMLTAAAGPALDSMTAAAPRGARATVAVGDSDRFQRGRGVTADGEVGAAKRETVRGIRAMAARALVAPTRDVTGPGVTSSVAMEAADLGILRWDPGRKAIVAMFGDNFEFVGMNGEWQSPSIVMYDNNYHVLGVPDPGNGIAMRRRSQLWPYGHNNPDYDTVLPCDFIHVNGWWYVAVMLSKGPLEREGAQFMTEFWRSRDLVSWQGPIVQLDHRRPGHPGNTMLTFDQIGDYIYIFGTGGLPRNKPIWMWRNPADQFPNGWWEPWGWDGSKWDWGIPNEGTPILHGGYGELSFRNVQGNCVLSYLDAFGGKQQARTVQHPEDNWQDEANVVDYALGDEIQNHYGGYISPLSHLDEGGGMHFWVSQWVNNDNYRVMLVQDTLRARGPLGAEPLREAAAPEPDLLTAARRREASGASQVKISVPGAPLCESLNGEVAARAGQERRTAHGSKAAAAPRKTSTSRASKGAEHRAAGDGKAGAAPRKASSNRASKSAEPRTTRSSTKARRNGG
jgi:hypothetical protein